MKPIKKYFIIFIIFFLAVILRAYRLDTFPSLNPDEAALGYNAYSLLLTGKDEHGISWPLHFKSFGDFKPGGYVYLAMPFIKTLGLTPLAVRLPNLILSVLTILVLYKLVLLLSSSAPLALLSSFVLAVSPWHIHFSRGAWESSAALFFIIFGIYLFYSYIKNHNLARRGGSHLFLFSLLSFVASLYLYHSARIVSPLIALSLMALYYKQLISGWKKLILPVIVAFIFVIPVAVSFLNSGGTTRFGGVGLSADMGPLNRSEELLNHHGNTFLSTRIIHNKRFLYLLAWSKNYLSHFDPNFLFINGDDVPRSRSPDMGQLYLIELPLLIFGIYRLIKSSLFDFRFKIFIVLFTLIAPLASSLTFQAPSALRSLPIVVPLTLLISYGLYKLIRLTSRFHPHNLFVLTVLYIFSIFYFVDAHFVHAPKRYPFAWNTGFSEVMPVAEYQKSNYQNIYITDTYDQPYILYLFYNRYDPQKLHPQIQLTPPDRFGFSTVARIDNIHFQKIVYDDIPKGSLIFAGTENVPSVPTAVVRFPNNTFGFKIYEK